MRNYYTLINSMGSGAAAIDSDAQAFITAAAITDSTQQTAINTLVTDLKGYGIWSKMKAIYPFVGGSASTHKWNLKDPRDLDVAYRLQFINGWTHSSTGALPNGTDGYANTFLNPTTTLTINNLHMSYYSRTNNAINGFDLGVVYTGIGGTYASLKWGDGNTYYRIGISASVARTQTSSAKNFIFNKIDSGFVSMFENNVQRDDYTTNSSLPNGLFYLGAINLDNTASLFANRQLAFASIGEGFTSTQALNFYTAIQNFNTTLGRQI